MANMINIKDGDAARVWMRDVESLNYETEELLKDIGRALQEVKDDADSTIVDEIYKYGSQILDNTGKILEGMNGLVKMVGGLLDALTNVLESGKNIISGAIKTIL